MTISVLLLLVLFYQHSIVAEYVFLLLHFA